MPVAVMVTVSKLSSNLLLIFSLCMIFAFGAASLLWQRPTMEVRREKEQGAVPGPGAVVTAKVCACNYPILESDVCLESLLLVFWGRICVTYPNYRCYLYRRVSYWLSWLFRRS